ncbi:MAG: prepilin-type N-terminal cleavage/methylation domain-containing protein [Candidatus Hydrogenedentes bacterium]|nr:prepilin-type N-terminal cleavage/methylation domain-containing protein [Candidatus Hydrogenedentota bacterium]
MRRSGFTLIEMLAAISLLTAALGMIWGAWLQASATADVLERKTDATDRAVHAMARISRELRAASRASLSALPAAEIAYRIPEDLDANGLPIDADGMPEWSGPRRIGRDYNDANGDGFTASQLILEHPGGVDVIANGLPAAEPPGVSPSGNPGIWFEARDGGILVQLEVVCLTRRAREVPARVAQFIALRNP